jgi:putative Holliday junction resolvase
MNDFSHYPRFQALQGKRILSIDFGTKVIGTAMFCPGRDPFPYVAEKIIYKSHDESVKVLAQLVLDEAIDVVVLGIPYFIDGKESTNTVAMKNFGGVLKKSLDTSIQFFEQDETLTTKTAEERMKNSPEYNFKVDPTKIDCLSAVIILEDFIRG